MEKTHLYLCDEEEMRLLIQGWFWIRSAKAAEGPLVSSGAVETRSLLSRVPGCHLYPCPACVS